MIMIVFFINVHPKYFYTPKRTAYPPQKAVLRHDQKPSHYVSFHIISGIPMPGIIHVRHPIVLLTWTIIPLTSKKVNHFVYFAD